MLTTKARGSLTAEQKQKKIAEARMFHYELLADNGALEKEFNFKSVFSNEGQKVVGIFPSEFRHPNGFFLELIDSNLDPIDPLRKVYRLRPTENYEDVYNILPTGSYAVPLEELELAKVKERKSEKFEVNFDTLNEVKDDNISNLTITDFAAIMWMKPVSEKGWLNNLINQNIV